MDQMAHAFTCKRNNKRWPMVKFSNMVDLASIASIVVFRANFPIDQLSHEDNRQRFNLEAGRALALPQIMRRAPIPTLQEPVRQNISTVLKTLLPTEPSASNSKKGEER